MNSASPIFQVGKSKRPGVCPFCNKNAAVITERVKLYDSNRKTNIIRSFDLYYCFDCRLPFASEDLPPVTHNNVIYRACHFKISTKVGLKAAKQRTTRKPGVIKAGIADHKAKPQKAAVKHDSKENRPMGSKELLCNGRYEIYPLAKVNLGSSKKNIIKINYPVSRCLCCDKVLMRFVNALQISESAAIKVPGQYCSQCDAFFIQTKEPIDEIVHKNKYLHDTKINYEYVFPGYVKSLSNAKNCGSAERIFFLKEQNEKIYKAVTIVRNKADQEESNGFYHYSDLLPRKILTETLRLSRTVQYHEKNYTILHDLKLDDSENASGFIVNKLEFRSGGGLSSCKRNKNVQLVDILMYSPYTKCLEVCPASYDMAEKDFFIDPKVFRTFVNKFGNPGIEICFYTGVSDDYFMRNESMLKLYGYNVSQADGLSTQYRQALLGEVMDLGLMSQHSILSLLEHNIRMHSSDKYIIARSKWDADHKYVMEYKVDPQRYGIFAFNR